MKNKTVILTLLAVLALSACNVQKRIVYIQDAVVDDPVTVAENNQIRIKPLDRLTVVVSSKDPELAAPFNSASTYTSLVGAMVSSSVNNSSALQIRTVTPEGLLEMPIIGTVECEGLTRSELAKAIADKIRDGGYISDPNVNVQFADMRISVIGEVARPGRYDITRDNITLFEALALAGDMTLYGVRSDVAVIREVGGQTTVEHLDLRNKDIFASPYFYLQQGDIVYVKPNRYRAATAEINQNRTFWLSIVGTLVSISTLVITITQLSK